VLGAVLAILLSMLGCAPAAEGGGRSIDSATTLVAIGGPEKSLTLFENAATKCGLTGVFRQKLDASSTIVQVVGPASWIWDDRSPYRCAIQWLLDHPNEGIGFVGNEAYRQTP
jgi:hypothetical protein